MSWKRSELLLVALAGMVGCRPLPDAPSEPVSGRSPIRHVQPYSEPFEPGALLAVLLPGADPEQVALDHDLSIEEELPDGLTLRFGLLPGEDMALKEAELAADARIDGVSPDFIVSDSESRQSSFAFDEGFLDIGEALDQDFLDRIGVPATRTTANGHGVLVAILDTGVNPNHPLLAGRIHPASHDFIENDTDPSDVPDGLDNDADGAVDEATGHGTHVAGLVAMVAPQSSLLILRVLDSDGRGPTFQVARAIEYAADAGAHIINMSLGVLAEPRALDEAISYAAERNVILVAAAGNWGADFPEEYPGSSRSVWAVAAADSLDRAASFTSYSRRVMISAPGTRLRSAYWNGGYAIWSGTSMAAPLVSGAAALLRQMHPTWPAESIRSRIEATSDPVYPTSSPQFGELGAGRIHVGRAVDPSKPPARKLPERAGS